MLTTKQNMAENTGVAVYLGHYANEHSQFMLITITRLTYTVFNICKYCTMHNQSHDATNGFDIFIPARQM